MTALSEPKSAEHALLDPLEHGHRLAMGLAIGIFAALSLAAGFSSVGFLEADGCTHYLYARFALRGSPHFLVNVWGRPLFTILYAVPSAFGGLTGAHLTSLVLAIACGLVAQRIARHQRYRWPVLGLIFTLGQPLVFLHSFSELTELPFAALLGLAFVAYQTRRWFWLALAAGLLPLSRPEGFGFVLLAAVALIAHRRYGWLFVLPLPLLAWNHAGWMLFGRAGPWWRWLIECWPYSSTSLYERGSPFHYLALLPAITSPIVFPATCLGIWRSLMRDSGKASEAHRRRCQILIAILPLLIVLAHSVLYAAGKLASSGEIRYMLIVAPFWGLLSARGWEWVWERLDWRAPLRWAGVAVLTAGIGNIIYPVLPLRPTDDWVRSERFVQWYKSSNAQERYPRVCAAQMTTYFMLDVSPTDEKRALEYRRDLLANPPPRTILVWDPIYSMYNADMRRSVGIDELKQYGWVELENSPEIGGGWRVFRSP
jgi:hypothetical protein